MNPETRHQFELHFEALTTEDGTATFRLDGGTSTPTFPWTLRHLGVYVASPAEGESVYDFQVWQNEITGHIDAVYSPGV